MTDNQRHVLALPSVMILDSDLLSLADRSGAVLWGYSNVPVHKPFKFHMHANAIFGIYE